MGGASGATQRSVNAIQVAPPAPRMAERDPYALRFAAVLLAFAAAVDGWARTVRPVRRRLRLARRRRGRRSGGKPHRRLDRPTALCRAAADGDRLQVGGAAETDGLRGFHTRRSRRAGPWSRRASRVRSRRSRAKTRRRQAAVGAALDDPRRRQGDDPARRKKGSRCRRCAVTPAGTPTIKLTEEPRANLSGTLTLAYRLDDHYGVAGARAEFALPHDAAKPAPRSLAAPPQAALQLPHDRQRRRATPALPPTFPSTHGQARA